MKEEHSLWEIKCVPKGFLGAQLVKNLPEMQETETKLHSLGQEDHPGEGNSNPLQNSCLENPHGQRSLEGAIVHGATRVEHELVIKPPLPTQVNSPIVRPCFAGLVFILYGNGPMIKRTLCGIFHRTRTNNFTICMEIQKPSNSQSNLEKEEWNWKNQPA